MMYTCIKCGKRFAGHYAGKHMYCSKVCADLAKHGKDNCKCDYCGKMFHLKPFLIRNRKNHYCSRECFIKHKSVLMSGSGNHQYGLRGELNSSFKGMSIIDKNHKRKYVKLYCPLHPYADKSGRVLAHRLIVEKNYKLFDIKYFELIDNKYYLKRNIDVHHIDDNPLNNTISNLIPVTWSEHTTIHNKERIIVRDNLGRISGVFKQGELLGNHSTNDNQQPSINSNVFEGSTTNSRIRTDNAEDSNANTSALPVNNGDDIV